MYHPYFDGPLLLHDDVGTYDRVRYHPRVHQRIIAKLMAGLGHMHFQEKTLALEPLPETMVDEGGASPTPDLILANNDNDTIPIIIEVSHRAGLKQDMRKIIKLIDEDLYGILDGFIYDYKTQIWYHYQVVNGGLLQETSVSEQLGLDLNKFLQTE
ncbi:hypothetical protein J2I47_00440 [Fibrella sp. HMF5335]|uniref:Uncharacterized protein n=1 Tax=Fibrella rubiginis TaxID=2817060 RepID=A0A939GE19_9BACT|nr:hypothetical protein [Fibrella rubiginis]MBO0935001.1 hypothetical protein [Fibrella rubiginis]